MRSTVSPAECGLCKPGIKRADAWVTKSLGTSPDKLPGSSVWCEICVICELVILIPGLVSQAQGLSSSNGSWRGSPQCTRCSSWAHWRHIWWPLSWSGILGESYNQTSHSKNRVQSFKMKIFMKEQYFGSPLCSPVCSSERVTALPV